MPLPDTIPEDLKSELKKRMDDQAEFLFLEDGTPAMTFNMGREEVHLMRCKKTGNLYGGINGFYTNGYRSHLTKEEDSLVRDIQARKSETARFDKAENINYADCKGEQFYFGDDYYIDVCDLLDSLSGDIGFNPDDYPSYVWSTEEKPIIGTKDAHNVYESDLEQLPDDYDDWRAKGADELQEALDLFVEENSGGTLFYPNYSKALLIGDQVKEYLERYED